MNPKKITLAISILIIITTALVVVYAQTNTSNDSLAPDGGEYPPVVEPDNVIGEITLPFPEPEPTPPGETIPSGGISEIMPESLKGQKMAHFVGQYFELTYPQSWQKNESYREDVGKGAFFYEVSPDIIEPYGSFENAINPVLWIDVKPTELTTVTPDPTEGGERVMIAGVQGSHTPYGMLGPLETYDFVFNGKYYSVFVSPLAIKHSDTTQEEVSWVLSTLKVRGE